MENCHNLQHLVQKMKTRQRTSFSEAKFMKKVLGSYCDMTSIKETRLYFGKLLSVIQEANIIDGDINGTAEEY